MRIVHLSDIHLWRYEFRPWRLLGKRALGMAALVRGRARRFRLERLADVVDHGRSLEPDHVLITGDLTTTAHPDEFRAARTALAPLLDGEIGATVIPGNHDRYTYFAARRYRFEAEFGRYAPRLVYPWLRKLDDETALVALDPTRHHYSARGFLDPRQLEEARELIARSDARRTIIACHYPLDAPPHHRAELRSKRLDNAAAVVSWLAGIGPHLYCCGHVHAAWAFSPDALPEQLCVNSGAPLLHDPTGERLPGFATIDLDGPDVEVTHHAWDGTAWLAVPMAHRTL